MPVDRGVSQLSLDVRLAGDLGVWGTNGTELVLGAGVRRQELTPE